MQELFLTFSELCLKWFLLYKFILFCRDMFIQCAKFSGYGLCGNTFLANFIYLLSLRWLAGNFIIDRFSLKRTYIFIITSSTHIWNFKQIVCLWSEIWGFKISILAMLKNAKILDKMLIFFKSTLYTWIKILQNLKRIIAVKCMQW